VASAAVVRAGRWCWEEEAGRVDEEIGIALVPERAGAEGGDLGIEGGTDPADLAPAHRGDPEGLDEVLWDMPEAGEEVPATAPRSRHETYERF
jgi:hypothetical protein